MTALAAHELRTPFAGLKTQAQVAVAASDPAIIRGALQQIVTALDRSARLVAQLLTIARLDAETAEPPRSRVEVGKLLDEVVAGIPRPARITVRIDDSARGLVLHTNAECLQLALCNLHENAVQHSHGEVAWTAEDDTLWVEDEGPGIPPDEMDKLGTRFFRGRLRSLVGSGLGLSIVKLALAKIGADLAVSNREGRSGVRSAVVFG